MVMKTVGIADLKAHLSEYLRAVRRGRTLTVLDRKSPIARLVPVEAGPLEVRRASRRTVDLAQPPPTTPATDSLALLLEDRARR